MKHRATPDARSGSAMSVVLVEAADEVEGV